MSAATPADRAVFLREADWIEEHCPDHGCVETETDGCHCEIAERLRRLADEAQQPPTDRDVVEAHDAALSFTRKAAETQPEPPVHGESVAHLAGLPGRRDQWADDEQADTLPAWLYQRFMVSGVGWDNLDEDDRSYWEHHARAVRRAVARGGFKQPAVDARQDGAPS